MEPRERADGTLGRRDAVVDDDLRAAWAPHVRLHRRRFAVHARPERAEGARSRSRRRRFRRHRGAAVSARIAIAGVALVAAASVGAAQQPSSAASPAALDSASAAQVARIVDDAQSKGLPVERIVAKVKLGLLIHTSTPRIVSAARAVAERLAPAPSAADIEAGEDALSVGIHADALEKLRAVNPRQSIAVPLGVLEQLVASGVSTKRATDMVTQLIRRGATNVQLVALGNDVDSDVGRGARADASLDARMNGLTAILAPGASATSASEAGSSLPTGPKRPKTP